MIEQLERNNLHESYKSAGLTEIEAKRRLEISGENRLTGKKKNSTWKIFAGQFHDVMVIILLISTVVSVLIGQYADAVPILVIVVINAILGFIQEYRCEKTLEKLEEMTSPTAHIYRDGELVTKAAHFVVTGDIIEVEAGDRIPADGIILKCKNFCCDESVLTGESISCEKRANAGEREISDSGLDYMAYMGTVCLKGNAMIEVTATGRATQMGKVSSLIEQVKVQQTPLQKKLGQLGKTLAWMCLGVCIIVFSAGVIRGEPILEMLMTGITIAIAAIPEGLPATVTIALALAVRRMLSRKALVHKLHSVETLGCATVICTDKTGTLTMNKMTVKKILSCSTDIKEYDMTETDKLILNNKKSTDSKALNELMICAAICNNAHLEKIKPSEKRDRKGYVSGFRAMGDPTESALLMAAVKSGVINDENLHKERIDEQPFDSETKFMSVTIREDDGSLTVYKKGASDVIISTCRFMYSSDGNIVPINENKKKLITKYNDEYASLGMRVLSFSSVEDDKEILLGSMAISDPPRPEARRAVKECQKAGIRTVMITGDHKLTACAIAREVGIMQDDDIVVTGVQIDKMSDEQLSEITDKASVYARVTPTHKLRIVRAFKNKGHICAMTGDGVNDAPAVKEASIGVSMGISGTDVTKQAADCILLDDNFSTLVSAVKEGRTIYQNIRKFVRYLISCNIGEVLTMFGGIIMGLPIVLIPSQILLVNLVTDGLPAIALGLENTEKNVMNKPPRKKDESFFSGGLLYRIVLRGILIGFCTLATFTVLLKTGCGLQTARTGALVTLVFSQLIHVFECKSEDRSIFKMNLLDNKFMLFAVGVSILCLIVCMYIPLFSEIFVLVHLSFTEWFTAIGFSALIPVVAALYR